MEKEQSEFRSAVGGGGMLCDWSEALGSHLSSLVAINLDKARILLFCHSGKLKMRTKFLTVDRSRI